MHEPKSPIRVGRPPDGIERQILSLSIAVSDKKALQFLACRKNTSMAAIIHELIVTCVLPELERLEHLQAD